MKRAKRHVSDPWYREEVLKLPRCALCGKRFTRHDRPEGHHVHGRDWKKNCKSGEEIHIDFRMILVCGPATDRDSCHAKLVTTHKDEQTRLVGETLAALEQDVNERMNQAGYIGR